MPVGIGPTLETERPPALILLVPTLQSAMCSLYPYTAPSALFPRQIHIGRYLSLPHSF
jgi:hypothetical protein